MYPPVEEMLDKVDSRYSLVIMAAKRARQLREMKNKEEDADNFKEVTSALQDIASGKITFERTKNGIK
jgi:DNA-directed RNA polymerase subunit omega